MTFSTTWKRIIKLEKKLLTLEDTLNKKREQMVSKSKPSLFFEIKELEWEEADFTLKTSSLIQNSDGVTHITEIGFEVMSEDAGKRSILDSKAAGFATTGFGAETVFDFEWNISLGASSIMYGQDMQSGNCMLSRESLGNPELGSRLFLKRPLYLKQNEFLDVIVKPIRNTAVANVSKYIVSMVFIGYKLLGVER